MAWCKEVSVACIKWSRVAQMANRERGKVIRLHVFSKIVSE